MSILLPIEKNLLLIRLQSYNIFICFPNVFFPFLSIFGKPSVFICKNMHFRPFLRFALSLDVLLKEDVLTVVDHIGELCDPVADNHHACLA